MLGNNIENETVVFGDKTVHYGNVGWIEKDVFVFDFGDGELIDDTGDPYFIHLEYHSKENQWIEEIFWDDDYMDYNKWVETTNQPKADLDTIEKFIMDNLMD